MGVWLMGSSGLSLCESDVSPVWSLLGPSVRPTLLDLALASRVVYARQFGVSTHVASSGFRCSLCRWELLETSALLKLYIHYFPSPGDLRESFCEERDIAA